MEAPAAREIHSAEEIGRAVRRMGSEITRDHPEGVTLVAILKGSVVLLSDLVRAIDVPVSVDFLAISHFAPDSGRVRIVKDLEDDIGGEDVVLVEDIVDTGLTLTFLLGHLESRRPRRVRVCTLLDRTRRRIVPVTIDYAGFDLEEDFVLGYGLDHAERYRNLGSVVAADLRGLQHDPDLHVPQLYGHAERGETPRGAG